MNVNLNFSDKKHNKRKQFKIRTREHSHDLSFTFSNQIWPTFTENVEKKKMGQE